MSENVSTRDINDVIDRIVEEARLDGMLKMVVSCPHCREENRVGFSGFAGRVIKRHRKCKWCQNEYVVMLMSQTFIK